MPPFNFEQLREDVIRRADAWRACELAERQRKRPARARECHQAAVALEQLAHDLEQQERDALEVR